MLHQLIIQQLDLIRILLFRHLLVLDIPPAVPALVAGIIAQRRTTLHQLHKQGTDHMNRSIVTQSVLSSAIHHSQGSQTGQNLLENPSSVLGIAAENVLQYIQGAKFELLVRAKGGFLVQVSYQDGGTRFWKVVKEGRHADVGNNHKHIVVQILGQDQCEGTSKKANDQWDEC